LMKSSRQRWRVSLQVKVTGLALLTVVLLAVALVYFYGRQMEETADIQLDRRGAAIAIGLAHECEYPLMVGNKTMLQQAATKALAQADVVSVVVFNASGKVMAAAGPVDVKAKAQVGAELAARHSEAIVEEAPRPGGVETYYLPVSVQPTSLVTDGSEDQSFAEGTSQVGQRLGLIELIVSHASTDAAVRQSQREALMITGACAGIVSLLCVVWVRRMARPLRGLVRGTQELADGNLNARVGAGTSDELGDLARAFNEMAESLQQSQAEVLDHQRNLERRVQERTIDLEREISERTRSEQALAERVRLATFVSDVSVALNQNRPVQEMLAPCAQAMVDHLNAAFARIWTLNEEANVLELQVSAGMYTHINGPHGRVPVGKFKIGLIAQERKPHMTNAVVGDPRVGDQEWAKREGMVGFAGFPLLADDRLLGVVAMFSRQPISDATMQAIASVANQIALGIDRKWSEMELERTHKQLLDASRSAGMAEVATNVLHNVGNVLNSINVSSALVVDKVRNSKVQSLGKVSALLKEHADDLGSYLWSDPKGKQLPVYLAGLAEHLADERAATLKELESLTKNVDHIKEIVAMQQSYAKVAGVVETLSVADLVEDALRLNTGSLARHGVEVVRQYEQVPPIPIEKHKVLQILINLVRNAKYAIDESRRTDKRLTMRIAANGNDTVKISVIDNGIGIAAENMTRIFGHGFTTRKDGHGFGLHSGALAAKELGGSLTAHSDGPGKGATFTLELPRRTQEGLSR